MTEPYHFDRGKPFYPIVMNYIIQLHAIKELLVMGVLGAGRRWDIIENIPEQERGGIDEALSAVLGPIELKVTGAAKTLSFPIDTVASELRANSTYLLPRQVTAAQSILVMAHEVTKLAPYRTTDPIWEFLRHCRNAAAHNGQWSFHGAEPRRPATWREIELSQGMHGTPMLRTGEIKGTLELGDPIALLWDIEQAYPEIRV